MRCLSNFYYRWYTNRVRPPRPSTSSTRASSR